MPVSGGELERIAGRLCERGRIEERHRAGEGAVGAPDLRVQRCRAESEEGEAAGDAEGDGTAAPGSGNDVADQHGAGHRTVALPELAPLGGGVGGEEHLRAQNEEIGGIAVARTRIEVAQQEGAGSGAVGAPELGTDEAVIEVHQDRPSDDDHVALVDVDPVGPRSELLDQRGAGRAAVGLSRARLRWHRRRR